MFCVCYEIYTRELSDVTPLGAASYLNELITKAASKLCESVR